MYILLTAVDHLADWGVMHRDIKPNNFLYDPATRTGLLIDFGLSEIAVNSDTQRPLKYPDHDQVKKIVQLQKHVRIRNRVGTKGYMPPEALFNYRNQTPAVDVWACGVIFLSFLAQRHPIFSLNNSSKVKNFTISNLIPFVCLFGSAAVKEIAFKYGYGCMIPDEMQRERVPWTDVCVVKDP
jgi:cell division control protein 7